MKNILLFSFLLTVVVTGCSSEPVYLFSYFKGNGEDGLHLAQSFDGLNWTALKGDSSFLVPQLSKDKLMRDPCIIKGPDGFYHMVWTVSWNDSGIGHATSTNLIDWTEQQYIPVMAHEPHVRNCWAPEVTYDPASKQYIIYWASTITGRYPDPPESKEGTYNHRMYYVLTKDFKTFTPAKILYDHGFSVIDATIVPDGNRYVMFLKDETIVPTPQKNLRVAFADRIEGPYSAPSAPITGDYWAEGPTVLRKDGMWTVYFDRYTEHRFGAIRSKDLKVWEDISDQISLPDGIRHGTIFVK